jgi:valyl-tRNA synthetase
MLKLNEMGQEVEKLCINIPVYMMCTTVSFNSETSVSRNVLQCPWRNTEVESEVEFLQKIIHTVRSARSDYNLPNKAKTEGMV